MDYSTPLNQIKYEEPKKSNKKPIIIAIVFLILLAGGMYFFSTFKKPVKTEESEKARVQAVYQKAGKLMILPKEDPLMADILDAEALKKSQSFYKDAEKGDYLLIFPTAAKAIIYSEKRNIIVNAGPVFNPETQNK